MVTARWSIPAEPQEVPALRSAVASYAAEHDVFEPPINDLRLAVSEAVTNAVVHAFRTGTPGKVDVSMTVDHAVREVRIVVADDGMGMVPRPDSPGLGLGLPMIATLSHTMEIRTPPDGRGTELCMTFELPVAA
jgi:anti-sigma regulatory factor (Ser/Thr protein kinase)